MCFPSHEQQYRIVELGISILGAEMGTIVSIKQNPQDFWHWSFHVFFISVNCWTWNFNIRCGNGNKCYHLEEFTGFSTPMLYVFFISWIAVSLVELGISIRIGNGHNNCFHFAYFTGFLTPKCYVVFFISWTAVLIVELGISILGVGVGIIVSI